MSQQITEKQLKEIIDEIDARIVSPQVRDISISFWANTAYFGALIGMGVISNIDPTSASAIGALGLGSLGIAANYKRMDNAGSKYLRDRRNLLCFLT